MEIDVGRQLDLLSDLEPALRRWPHGESGARTGLRYRPDNGFFGWTDAQVWYALLATRRPRKVVEVAVGGVPHSSSTPATKRTCPPG